MSEFNFKDIRETQSFKRGDYLYTKVAEKDGWYLFHMEPISEELKGNVHYLNYEIVKAKPQYGVQVYPPSAEFGVYGFYYCGTTEIIRKKMENRAKMKGWDWSYFYPLVG